MQCCVLQEALMNFVPPTLVPGAEGRFQAASAGGQFARFADSGMACGVWLPGLLQALLCTGLCPAKLCLCCALPCAPGCLSPAAAPVLAVPSVLCQRSPQGQLWGHCCLSPPVQLGHKARSYPGQERAGAFSVLASTFLEAKASWAAGRVWKQGATQQLQAHVSSNGQGISWVLALSHIAGLGAGVEDSPVLALHGPTRAGRKADCDVRCG